MTPPEQSPALAREPDFALGTLTVRPSTREVLDGREATLLEPRVMQVLSALARQRGKVVSRADLVAECWGGRGVGDDAINRCIQALRRLAESRGGFAIRTVKRVGYRLDAADADAGRPVLAVLAFDNLSGDPGLTWFSDGLSVEILQTVARGGDARVVGQGSSFQFRGADKAAARVAADLGATHVLDGSVRRAGLRLRVSAHLVEGASGLALWSMTFERELADVFAVQDEIAGAVTAALRSAFAPGRPAERLDPAVHDLYLRARTPPGAFGGGVGEGEAARSLELLDRVTREAPGFARAWAELAIWRVICLRRFDRARFPDLTLESVGSAAETALKLDGSLGLPHQALSYLAPLAAYAERETLHGRAMAAAPGDPQVLNLAGQFLAEVGRLNEALALASKAAELDPLYWPAVQWKAGLLGALGRHEESRALWDASLARWPEVEALAGEAIADAANAGDWARLDALIEDSRRRGHVSSRFLAFAQAQADRRHPRAEMLAMHRERMTARFLRDRRVSLIDLSQLYEMGAADEAFDYVERASFGHMFEPGGPIRSGPWAPAVLFVAANRAMVADPRFPRLCGKLGLADYWVRSGRWPDCVDAPGLGYDLRAACRGLVEV